MCTLSDDKDSEVRKNYALYKYKQEQDYITGIYYMKRTENNQAMYKANYYGN